MKRQFFGMTCRGDWFLLLVDSFWPWYTFLSNYCSQYFSVSDGCFIVLFSTVIFHVSLPLKISFLSVTNNLCEQQFSYISINHHWNLHEVNSLGTNILTATKFRGDTPGLILGREVELLITIIYMNHLGNNVSTNFLNKSNQVSDRNSTFAKENLITYHVWFLFRNLGIISIKRFEKIFYIHL